MCWIWFFFLRFHPCIITMLYWKAEKEAFLEFNSSLDFLAIDKWVFVTRRTWLLLKNVLFCVTCFKSNIRSYCKLTWESFISKRERSACLCDVWVYCVFLLEELFWTNKKIESRVVVSSVYCLLWFRSYLLRFVFQYSKAMIFTTAYNFIFFFFSVQNIDKQSLMSCEPQQRNS